MAEPDGNCWVRPDGSPRVSFVLLAYAQERFVRAAVEGALAQTLVPLDILLSDDSSPDATFEIMRKAVAGYDGPHRVRLNRNPRNLGLIGHVNRAMELVQGDFIVVAAGDDISEPDRALHLADAWRLGAGRVHLVHSQARRIDSLGRPGGIVDFNPRLATEPAPPLLTFLGWNFLHRGATAGWSREVFDRFGPLPEGIAQVEDTPIFYRAALLGGTAHVDAPLVRYRSDGISRPTRRRRGEILLFGLHDRVWDWRVSCARTLLHDLAQIEHPDKAAAVAALEARLVRLERRRDLARMSPLRRLAALPRALSEARAAHSGEPLRDWARYAFAPLAIRWIELHDRRRGRPAP